MPFDNQHRIRRFLNHRFANRAKERAISWIIGRTNDDEVIFIGVAFVDNRFLDSFSIRNLQRRIRGDLAKLGHDNFLKVRDHVLVGFLINFLRDHSNVIHM